MSVRINTKANKRFVMYIPGELRDEIEAWVGRKGSSLAEFGRAAFEFYLCVKKKEERNQQLAETCRIFDTDTESATDPWHTTEREAWPS